MWKHVVSLYSPRSQAETHAHEAWAKGLISGCFSIAQSLPNLFRKEEVHFDGALGNLQGENERAPTVRGCTLPDTTLGRVARMLKAARGWQAGSPRGRTVERQERRQQWTGIRRRHSRTNTNTRSAQWSGGCARHR